MNDLHAELHTRAERRLGSTLRRGKYALERLLGVGSMGAVFEARHRSGSRVAVKILHPELSRIDPVKERFLRDGYIANRVRHPGIVRVIDDDIDDDGATFLVLELLDGITVARLREEAGGQLPLERVGAILDDILDVLEVIHAEGIVHRDIKPENVFLTPGALKLLDLGIARLVEAHVSVAESGQMMGTPEFVAPEQAAGGPGEMIDARTDLYSVGALAFTLLTGRYVHEGRDAMETMIFAATRPAPSIFDIWPSAPPLVANVIDMALSFDRERRWASASAMRTALSTAMAESVPFDLATPRVPVKRHPGSDPVAPVGPMLLDGSLPLSEHAAEPLPLVRPSKRGPG